MMTFVECPTCGAPAEVMGSGNAIVPDAGPGMVEVLCAAGHRLLVPTSITGTGTS